METYDYVYIQMYSFKTNNCFLPAHYVTWLAAPDRSETGMFILWTVHVLTAGFTLGMASANERRCLSLAETIPRMIPELYLVANKLCAQLTINQISDFCFFHLDHYLASFILFPDNKERRIAVDETSIWHFCVGSISNWHQSEGFSCLGFQKVLVKLMISLLTLGWCNYF